MTEEKENVSCETVPLDDLGPLPKVRVDKILQKFDEMTAQEKIALLEYLGKYQEIMMENKSE